MATKTFSNNTFHDRKRNSNERWESSPKKKKQSSDGKNGGILVIQAKIRDRSESLDLIPACVPQSVGLEIENILHNSFGHGKDSFDLDSKLSTAKRKRSPKKKSPRTMSTEDLPPNLLPEDYLDEVISQYFNNDSNSDDPEQSDILSNKRESLQTYPSDEEDTSEHEEDEDKHYDNHDTNDNVQESSKNKVKTDEEMESEYKHIIFGAKKRKGPRIGFGSPKKKKKSKEKVEPIKLKDKTESKMMKPSENFTIPQQPKQEKSVMKQETPKQHQQSNIKKKAVEPAELQSSTTSESVIKTEDSLVHKWSGKKASKKAFDRSKLLLTDKKLFTSPKIEDVTGKYGKEEELVTCGLCDCLDPPVDPGNPHSSAETTEWVGCDCFRWFHRCCTKLTKITEKFSCKSVRMKCQESVKTEPAPAVLQVAILRFIRDRDISFIEDLIN